MRLIFTVFLLTFLVVSQSRAEPMRYITNPAPPDPQLDILIKQQQETLEQMKLIEKHLAAIEKLVEYQATLQHGQAVQQIQQKAADTAATAPLTAPAPLAAPAATGR